MNHSQLIEKLKSPHEGDVVTALRDIEKQRNMRDLSLTISMIRNSNKTIKRTAIEATVTIIRDSILANYHTLGVEGRQKLAHIINTVHPETIQELIRDVHSNSEEQRVHGLMILGLMRRKPNIRRILETQVKSSNEKVRATAIQALGNFPDTNQIHILIKQLNDSDERVRANAVEALEQFGDSKMIFSLKRLVRDENNRVRANAIKALYNLGERHIEKDIFIMLQNKKPLMLASGLWLIVELSVKNDELVEACLLLKTHPDPMVRRNAELAIEAFKKMED